MKTRKKKIQEKCKDDENTNNGNNGNDACLIVLTLLNGSHTFLNKVEDYESVNINTIVECTNVFAKNGNVEVQRVDTKLNEIIIGNSRNIIDELQFFLIPILDVNHF